MIEVEKTITNLFLIKDKPEHQAIIELTKKHGLTNFEILTIKDKPPYLVNNCADLEKVSTWQEFGISDPGCSRFWLDKYNEIDDIISVEMAKNQKYKNEIIQSPYFKFDLVWLLGRQYYDVINSLNEFFQRFRPEAIYFRPENTFIDNVIFSFARIYKIECWKLS
jgi:hypothetical protein